MSIREIVYFRMNAKPPIHLLFIDGDASYMAVAQHLLSKYQGRSFEIVWKKSGAEGIAHLEGSNQGIDLILLDFHLPGTNGLDVAREIREKKIEIPLIFLTSSRDFRLAVEGMKYGVEDYLLKDEAVDSVLPRTIVNILERVHLKKRIAEQMKADLITQKRTDAIKELVVAVCHEFNNPLAAIKISTDIILRQKLSDDEKSMMQSLDRNIAVVEREINRLRDINFDRPEWSDGSEERSAEGH
jgi:DNA-binding response OmpR family regulator